MVTTHLGNVDGAGRTVRPRGSPEVAGMVAPHELKPPGLNQSAPSDEQSYGKHKDSPPPQIRHRTGISSSCGGPRHPQPIPRPARNLSAPTTRRRGDQSMDHYRPLINGSSVLAAARPVSAWQRRRQVLHPPSPLGCPTPTRSSSNPRSLYRLTNPPNKIM